MLLLLALALALPACGGDGQETGEKQATEQEESTKKDGGGRTERNGEDRTEKDRAKGKDRGASSEEVSLEIGGDTGAGFSGACYVGDEEFELGGQAPESFDYELGGQRLECEILNEGPGSLEIVLVADDTRSVQQLSAGTLNLIYADGLVSASTSSGPTGSQQVISQSSNSGSSANSSSVVSSSSSTDSR